MTEISTCRNHRGSHIEVGGELPTHNLQFGQCINLLIFENNYRKRIDECFLI